MEQEVIDILLNGMEVGKFVGFFLIGSIGGLMFFLHNLYTGITLNPNTPYKFSWRYFVRGAIRVVLSLVSLAFVILNFEELGPWLFSVEEIELKPVSALLIGMGIDGIVKKLMSVGIGGYNTVKRKKL